MITSWDADLSVTIEEPVNAWEEAIRTFEAADQVNPPAPGQILFTGSSTIGLWKTLAQDMQPLSVIGRGFGGSEMSDLLYFADRIIIPYRPQAVVIYEGDNDLVVRKAPEHVQVALRALTAKIRAALPNIPLYILSVKPSPSRMDMWSQCARLNELYQEYVAQTPGTTYIDTATPMLTPEGEVRMEYYLEDRLHMNALGYALWASLIKPVLLAHEG